MSEKIELPEMPEPVAKKRMTPADWGKANAMWSSGEYTLAQLSEEFGVTIETLSRRFKKAKISKGEDSVASLIKKSVIDTATTRVKERAERAETRRNQFDGYASTLAKLVMKTVADCSKAGTPFARIEGDVKTLQRAADALSKCFGTVSKALQLDTTETEEEDIPKLVVGQLTEEQVKQYRKMQSDDDIQDEDDDLVDDVALDSIPLPEDADIPENKTLEVK